MRSLLTFCAMAILALAALAVPSAAANEGMQYGSVTTGTIASLPESRPTQVVETGSTLVAVLPSTSTGSDSGMLASLAIGSVALAVMVGGAIAFGVRRGR